MKTLLIRSLSGLVFVTIVIGSLLLSPLAFSIVMVIIAQIAFEEYRSLTSSFPSIKNRLLGSIVFFTGMLVVLLSFPDETGLLSIKTCLYILLTVNIVYFIMSILSVKNSFSVLSGLYYIGLPFILSILLISGYINAEPDGKTILLGLFIILWSHDSFAYLTGWLIGKTPLMPSVSPKKTIEGSIGGVVFAIATAYLFNLLTEGDRLIFWIVAAVVIAITGTIGDLFESKLKRKANVKDSGNIMPGHGGILDRFDAFLFSLPAVFALHFLWSLMTQS